jgi:hypothetical protein
MKSYPLTCDIATIQEMETNYKRQLAEDPANMEIREDLAWCLFMHALHEAGRESLLESITAAVNESDRNAVFDEVRLMDQKAYQLLRACLLETFTILQLSPQTQRDVTKLHTLIRLSGADQAFHDAEDDASRILSRLSRDIALTTDS